MNLSRTNPQQAGLAFGLVLLGPYFIWAPALAVRPLIVALGVLLWRRQRGARPESMLLAFVFSMYGVFVWHVAFVSGLGAYLVITLTFVALFNWPADARVSTFENLRTKWRAVVRCFGPPGARGTMHARWFAVGLWLAYLPHTRAKPSDTCFVIWAVTALVMWGVRWIRPRWDPSVLIRVSLLTSGTLILLCNYADGWRPHASRFAMAGFGAITLAIVWQLHERLTVAHLYAGTHPSWILDGEHGASQRIIYTRVHCGAYRSQARGERVGWLPAKPTRVV
ncbi:MAG: hypothetical protein AB8H86_22205 [Polyangiales bacterium]